MLRKESKPHARGLARFIAATFVVALLYIVLQGTWLVLAGALAQQSWAPAWVLAGDLEKEARQVAEQSAQRESALTPQHRQAAFELGYHLGYTAAALGAATASTDEAGREELRQGLASRVEQARSLAAFLGAGEATPFPAGTMAEYLRLAATIEADETKLAARVESGATRRHRHLFLLGAHVGVTAAQVDIASLQTPQIWPAPPLSIAHHATLAGLARDAWNPLLQIDTGREPAKVAQAYRQSVAALSQALSR
jgi:hypothetical protein